MHHTISSIITGTVLKFEATEGQVVTRGDTLLLIESMKMEIPIESPGPGRLLKFLIAEGDAVTEGQALATFQAA